MTMFSETESSVGALETLTERETESTAVDKTSFLFAHSGLLGDGSKSSAPLLDAILHCAGTSQIAAASEDATPEYLFSVRQLSELRSECRKARERMRKHCLVFAEKFNAEMTVALTKQLEFQRTLAVGDLVVSGPKTKLTTTTTTRPPPVAADSGSSAEDALVADMLAVARSRMATKEWQSAFEWLDSHSAVCVSNATAFFLWNYAEYMAALLQLEDTGQSEKSNDTFRRICRRIEKHIDIDTDLDEDSESKDALADGSVAKKRKSSEMMDASSSSGLCLFLLGSVQRELGQMDKARESLLQAVWREPMNWSAWRALCEVAATDEISIAKVVCALISGRLLPTQASLCGTEHMQAVSSLLAATTRRRPPPSTQSAIGSALFRTLFVCELLAECSDALFGGSPLLEQRIISWVRTVSASLTDSRHALVRLALVLYKLQRLDESCFVFAELCAADGGFHTEAMDIYANILFVKEARSQLSELASRCFAADKYCAETCAVVGNYYALYGMHRVALSYLRRATALNTSFVSGYILCGHECIELRLAKEAMGWYLKALRVAKRADYRVHYGMALTYELLSDLRSALFYHKYATALRPFDARLWHALGLCHLKNNEPKKAKTAFVRGANSGHSSTAHCSLCTFQLAKVCDKLGENKRALAAFQNFIGTLDKSDIVTTAQFLALIEALLFVARHLVDSGQHKQASVLLQRVLQNNGSALFTAPKNQRLAAQRMLQQLSKEQQCAERGFAPFAPFDKSSDDESSDEMLVD